jgi:hypothetical protein
MKTWRNDRRGAKKRWAITVMLSDGRRGLHIKGGERLRTGVICNCKRNRNGRNGQVGVSHGVIQDGLDRVTKGRGRDGILKRPALTQIIRQEVSNRLNNEQNGERRRKYGIQQQSIMI